jgi:hypothetical protein
MCKAMNNSKTQLTKFAKAIGDPVREKEILISWTSLRVPA